MEWLTNKTLARKVRDNAAVETLNAFHGIYSIDDLPKSIPTRPFLMIVNTHTKNLPGEHWLAVFIDKDKNGEIFDSLALPVSNILIQWMNRFTAKWKINKRTFQHSQSTSCGAFVLYYILLRLHMLDMDSVTAAFTPYPSVNENVLEAFYKTLK